jgi:hypothetical protein
MEIVHEEESSSAKKLKQVIFIITMEEGDT